MMKYIYNDGGRGDYFDTKYKKDRTNDCVIRAIAIATERDYLTIWEELFTLSTKMGFMPNDKKCYEEYLRCLGWVKHSPIKNKSTGKKYELRKLGDHFRRLGKYKGVIVKTTRNLSAIVDGDLHDSWDCRRWCANSYWLSITDN